MKMTVSYTTLDQALRTGHAPEVLPGWLAGTLEDICAGRGVQAVRHPLGFVCLPLYRSGAEGICVHLWNTRLAPARPTTSSVHCHSWNLHSYVLYGRLSNQRFEIRDSLDNPQHRLFKVHNWDEVDQIIPTPRLVSALPGPVEWYGPGEAYQIPVGEFHVSGFSPAIETATIVLGRYQPGMPDLSVGRIDLAAHQTRRHRLDASETTQLAGSIRHKLSVPTGRAEISRQPVMSNR